MGVASSALLSESVGRIETEGWAVSRAQVSLVGARPKLGANRLDEMRDKIALLLGTEVGSVSVTASTGNLAGPEGAGRVIRATALVTVHRR